MESPLKSVQFLKGVGPKRAKLLNALGIHTVSDLLHYFPRAWQDRRESARSDDTVGPFVLKARVQRTATLSSRPPLEIFKAVLKSPAEPRPIEAVWFRRHSFRYDVFQKLKEDLKPGTDVWVVGAPEGDPLAPRQVRVEECYALDDPRAHWHVDRIVPVYGATEGLSQKILRELAAQALDAAQGVPDLIPPSLLQKRLLLAPEQALRAIHFPKSFAELEEARRRLAYEELLLFNLAWIRKRRQTKNEIKSHRYQIKKTLLTPFRRQLQFQLTQAQKRVINEIFEDMLAGSPMTRLLQGDVGSGKTVVAIAALLLAVENGFQGAFMAPTEILAEQHFWTLRHFLKGLPIQISLLTSRVPPKARSLARQGIQKGEIHIVIGTHALLEEEVRFKNLKIAVIDEQHRFGVRQRTTLRRKGDPMDLLIMTATPIPRTLSLAMYGDLFVSTIDELPPGRVPIATRQGSEAEALEAVRAEASAGRQAYVVYPIIAESDKLDLKAAQSEFERLSGTVLKGLRTELIHGRMKSDQKTSVMRKFTEGEIDVLISTQVVEVGVDVANASIIVVQNADRFGLASLHQLRGRVGRGRHPSQCWLVADARTPEAKKRLDILCAHSDGFYIAEEDLKLRGPGDILGTLQHGEVGLRVADLIKDADLQTQARSDAEELSTQDPDLLLPEHRPLRERFLELSQRQWSSVDLA